MLDKMLAQITGEGRFLSRGAFTLDPEKALRKMKQFQLADPHAYAVHLVTAGIAGGATRVEVYNDADDCIVTFDGPPLSKEDLRDLFSSLFVKLEDPSLRRLRELAIGTNAALGFQPRWVRIDSGGTRLELQGERYLLTEQDGPCETRIHVKERASWQVVKKFLGKLRDLPPEGRAIRERCCFSLVPILVNGVPVSAPPAPLGGLVQRLLSHPDFALPESGTVVRSPGAFAAVLTMSPSPDESWVVLNGVRFPLAFPWPFSAIVFCSHLQTNVSQTGLVQSSEWTELMAILQKQRKSMVDELAESSSSAEAGAREILLAELPHRLADPRYLKLPLFELSDGNQVSVRPLLKVAESLGYLPYCTRPWGIWPLDGVPVVVASGAAEQCLKAIFKQRQDYSERLLEASRAASNREAWESLPPRPVALLVGFYLSRLTLPEGEIGLPAGQVPGESRFTLLRQQRPLGTVAWSGGTELPDGILGEINHDDLAPTPLWDGVRPEQPALEEILRSVRDRLDQLYRPLLSLDPAADDVRRHLLAYLLYCRSRQIDRPELETMALFLDPQRNVPTWSYRQLQAELEKRGFVAYSYRRWRVPPIDGAWVIRIEPAETAFLARLFPRLENYEVRLAEAEGRQQHYLRWLEQPEESRVRLPEQPYLARVPLERLDGEIGVLARLPYGGARGIFFRNRRRLGGDQPLRTFTQTELPLGLWVAAGHDALEGDARWENVVPGEATDSIMEAIREALPRLWKAVVERLPEDEAGLAAVRFNVLNPGGEALAGVPLFRRLSGGRASLEELDGEVARRGFLALVGDPSAQPVPGVDALALSVDEVGLFAERYGPARLQNREEEYLAALCRQDFELNQQERVALEEMQCRRPVVGELWEGEVGLPAVLDGPRVARIRVLYGSRFLDEWSIPTELGPLEAVIYVREGGLTPRSDWSGAEDDDLAAAVVRSVLAAARALAEDLARGGELSAAARHYLWRQLAAEPTGGLAEAPLFPLCQGGALSLAQLRGRHRVEYLKQVPALPVEPGHPLVLADFPEAETLLGRIVGWERVIHVGPEMEARARAKIHRSSPARLEFRLERSYIARGDLSQPRRGEVGLLQQAEGDSRIEVYRDGRLLETVTLRLSIVLECVVEDNAVVPSRDWRGVARDPAWESLVRAVENLGRQLAVQLARSASEEARAMLLEMAQVLVLESRHALGDLEQALLAAPLYEAHDGQRLCLADLQEAARADGELLYVRNPVSAEFVPQGVRLPVLSSQLVPALRSLAPRNVADRIAAAEAVLRLPPQEPVLEGVSELPRKRLAAPLAGQLQLAGGESGHCTVLLFWRGRPVERVTLTKTVDFRAVVNDDRLWLDTEKRFVRNAAFRALLKELRRCSHQLALTAPPDLHREVLLKLAGRTQGELKESIWAIELLRDEQGEFWSLSTLKGQRLHFFSATWNAGPAELTREVLNGWPVPLFRLTDAEVRRLEELGWSVDDVTAELEEILARRSGRLRSFRLEDAFPEKRWAATHRFEQADLRGELGVPLGASAPGGILRYSQGFFAGSLSLSNDLLGIVDAPLDDFSEDQIRSRLLPLHRELLDSLWQSFPAPGEDGFQEARRAVLSQVDWRARAEDPDPLVQRLRSLRILPLPEGRLATLDDLFQQVRRGGVPFVRPGQCPPAGEDLVLELSAGELEDLLRVILAGSLVHAREWVSATSPRELLVETIRSEFSLLGARAFGLDEELMATLRCGETSPGTLCDCPGEGEWVLNPLHPAAARLLDDPSEFHPARLYYVMSALFSVLNRKLPQLEDYHERQFHARLLEALLGGRPQRS